MLKRYISMFLIFTIVLGGVMEVGTTVTGGEISYDKSYGEQLADGNEKYSQLFYDEMVQNYVYQDTGEGNDDGRYTGLAKPIENGGAFTISLEGEQFSEKAETQSKFEADVLAWFYPLFTEINKSLTAATDAFLKDYPQVFWMEGAKVEAKILIEETPAEDVFWGTATVRLILTPTEYGEGMSENISAFNEAVWNTKKKIMNQYGISETTNPADVARCIHNYIAEKTEYNFDAAKNSGVAEYAYAYTPLPVFLDNSLWEKGVVCQGYAKSFMILCKQFGLECALMAGRSINYEGNFEYHEWNAVKISGKWYAVDVTWDDQKSGICYNYFLAGKGSVGFFQYTYKEDHIEENTFSDYENARKFLLPEISDDGFYASEGESRSDVQTPETTSASFGDEEQTTTDDAENPTQPGNEDEPTGTGEQNNPTDTSGSISADKNEETTKNLNANVTIITKKYHWVITGVRKSVAYTGKQIKQDIKVTCDETTVKESKDYKVSYKNNVNAGKASMILTPIGKYQGIAPLVYEFTISKAPIKQTKVKKVKAQKYENGKAIKPKVTVKFKGKKLKKGKDYKISYINNKKRGTGKIIIKGKGNFKGKKVIKFKIK